MKKILILFSLAIFTACSAYLVPSPLQSDADRATQKFPDITLANLTEGKTLFQQSCGHCHSLKKPFSRNEEQLKLIMPNMARKAHIDSKTQDLILKYLITMSAAKQK